MQPKPRDKWTVYGTVLSEQSRRCVTREFDTEGLAWAHVIELRCRHERIDAVLVHTTHREAVYKNYRWRPINTVLARFNAGRAWFE